MFTKLQVHLTEKWLPEKWLQAFPHPLVALAMPIHFPPEAVLGIALRGGAGLGLWLAEAIHYRPGVLRIGKCPWDLGSAPDLSSILSPGRGSLGQGGVDPAGRPRADPQLGGDLGPATASAAELADFVTAADLVRPAHVLALRTGRRADVAEWMPWNYRETLARG